VDLICRRCNRPVHIEKELYEVFEQMHWTCFHFEFEHGDHDPDEPCDAPGCPWHRLSPVESLTVATAFLRERNDQLNSSDIRELISWMQGDEASLAWIRFVMEHRPKRRMDHDT
jgi:hypothetical protein